MAGNELYEKTRHNSEGHIILTDWFNLSLLQVAPPSSMQIHKEIILKICEDQIKTQLGTLAWTTEMIS
jgi:hypothetical protein